MTRSSSDQHLFPRETPIVYCALCECLLFISRFLLGYFVSFSYSDASATGCGSVITFNEDYVCLNVWDPSESIRSSTWRVLAAIDFFIESFSPVLEGSLVKWFTDNQVAAKIVEVGSKHETRSAPPSH